MEDGEAIRRCLEGDSDAFRALVDRYEREALAHARVLLGDLERGRDAVQEAFLDAFRSLERFDLGRSFYPWFYVLLRNRCLKRRSPRREISVETLPLLESRSGASGEVRGLEEALRKLDPEDREILTLKYFDGLSYRDIAERLSVPIGTVMSRLFTARRSLRKELE
jgi:RNA polymerase sigma-70 factor, ECF subfamily